MIDHGRSDVAAAKSSSKARCDENAFSGNGPRDGH